MRGVKSQLRRYTQLGAMQTTEKQIVIRGLVVDTESKTVTVDGDAVRLTPLEYKILELLCRHPGKVFSTEEIYRQVWKDEVVSDNAIAVHVRHIREKIEINPKEPRYLKVVWGRGLQDRRGAKEHEKGDTVAHIEGHCVCRLLDLRGRGGIKAGNTLEWFEDQTMKRGGNSIYLLEPSFEQSQMLNGNFDVAALILNDALWNGGTQEDVARQLEQNYIGDYYATLGVRCSRTPT